MIHEENSAAKRYWPLKCYLPRSGPNSISTRYAFSKWPTSEATQHTRAVPEISGPLPTNEAA